MQPKRKPSEADNVIFWIEKCCVVPAGPDKGTPVRLSLHEKHTIKFVYDEQTAQLEHPITGPLAAYIALLHTCGPQAKDRIPLPLIETNVFSVWEAAGQPCIEFLRREGSRIVCPQLGTAFSKAA